ncbi:hypothetical protein ACFSBZ_12280 [Amnibacterium flavum]|uniref:Uncharacterized protein n=1 Tax=Amnibacterium flavum TaxID=2173173 RepID=A0A2V1HYJ1_9MICO|nr:hypothetical protein [Amnibacterium flavum]PVZ95574.1 hypothetical protein DDQ50_03485 [Amnibacterium flavum]
MFSLIAPRPLVRFSAHLLAAAAVTASLLGGALLATQSHNADAAPVQARLTTPSTVDPIDDVQLPTLADDAR